MLTGTKRLAEWLERSKLSQRKAADVLGFHWTHLNHILMGRRNPGLANAVHIEAVTGIAVEAWLPTSVGAKSDKPLVGAGNSRVGRK